MAQDISCLYSTVRNTSGRRRTFGYLPPHGRSLAHGEEFTVFGDIKQAIIPFDRGESMRAIVAFEKDLQNGRIDIVNTDAPILRDINNPDNNYQLVVRGGTLGIESPCWEVSLSDTLPYG